MELIRENNESNTAVLKRADKADVTMLIDNIEQQRVTTPFKISGYEISKLKEEDVPLFNELVSGWAERMTVPFSFFLSEHGVNGHFSYAYTAHFGMEKDQLVGVLVAFNMSAERIRRRKVNGANKGQDNPDFKHYNLSNSTSKAFKGFERMS